MSSLTDTKKAITLRDLLTMRAPYIFKPLQEPMEKLVKQKDWITFSLDMLGKNGNIGEFKYANSSAHLLSAVLTRTTGKSAREFANAYLFQPIGMNEIEDNPNQTYDYEGLFGERLKGWAKDPSGNSTGGWGITLTTRDMARFGSLYINDGIVNKQQIIPKEWIKESTVGLPFEKDIGVVFNRYGYLWCIYKKDTIFAYMALGDGGNMICCIPDKEIVVAIASKTMRKPRERWELIEKYILPSII
ncbi:MAG: serine hydrolase domain-containing protein [Coprobacillaceae bacterium]